LARRSYGYWNAARLARTDAGLVAHRLIFCAALLIAAIATAPAQAQNGTWNGTTSADWNTGSNWSSVPANSVPTTTGSFGTSA